MIKVFKNQDDAGGFFSWLRKNTDIVLVSGPLVEDIKSLVHYALQFEGRDFDEVVFDADIHGIKPKSISEEGWQRLLAQYDDARNSIIDHSCLDRSLTAMERLAEFTEGHVFCSAVRLCKMLEKN